MIEALEICFYKNCSTYKGQHWLQTDGTVMGPKNSFSYADIVAECVDLSVFEAKILEFNEFLEKRTNIHM